MKSIAKKLTSVLLALALVCGLAAVAAHATYGAGTKFVVLGDSIAAGDWASDPSKPYARLIADSRGFELANHAVGGATSNDLLRLLEERADVVQAIEDADIINLSIGGNDLLSSNVITLVVRLLFLGDETAADEYIASFAENFEVIVPKIRVLMKPGARFIVQTLYNSMAGVPLVANAYEVAIVKLNQVYYDYLDANQGAYEIADVYAAFRGREGLIFDDKVHPSDLGHEMIAQVLTAAIDGTAPPETLTPAEPGFFQQIGIFLCALYDYLSYWLSIYPPLELLGKVFSFIV